MDEAIKESQTADAASDSTNESSSPTSIQNLERKMKVKGTVRSVELYGAFVDIGVGVDGILHISQLDGRKANRIADVLNVGDEVDLWIDSINRETGQIMLTMVEPQAVDWPDLAEGKVFTGTVTRLENFGAFVNIGAEKDGLVHVSELSHDFVKHPSQAVAVGDEVQVQVLTFSKRKRRINLSIKALLEKPGQAEPSYEPAYEEWVDDEPEVQEEMPTAMEIAMRQAMGEPIDSIADFRDGRRSKKSRRRNKKRRRQQAEIIARTLNMDND